VQHEATRNAEAAAREAAAREQQAAQQREQQAAQQREQQQRAEAARATMAQEAARREAEEMRRRAIAQEEEEAHRIAVQQQMQREEEALARQREAHEATRRQAHEIEVHRVALEDQQRRHREAEAAMHRQAEALAQQQRALEEQKRAMAMLPPANTPGAGSALLSLLQGGTRSAGGNDMALPGWAGQQQGAMHAASQLEQLWAQASPAAESNPGAEQGLGRGGRGRGRGVCSAALGTGRAVSREDLFSSAGALAGLSLGHGEGLGLPTPDAYADADARLEAEDEEEDARRGRKGRAAPKVRGKDFETFGADAELSAGGDGNPGRLGAAWAGAAPPAKAALPPSQPAKGWGAPAPSVAVARVAAPGRASMHEIQEAEERERCKHEAAAAQALQVARAAAGPMPQGAWGGSAKAPAAPPPAPPREPPRAPPRAPPPTKPPPQQQQPVADEGLLWDYDAAPNGKGKKKKGKDANGALEKGNDFELGGGQMPPTMTKWCEEQMRGLTGR